MNPYSIHADGISDLLAEAGGDCPTFTWLNNPYQIIPGTAMTNKPLRDGGFSQMYDLSFTTTVAQFNTDANTLKDQLLNQPIQYLGIDYKIIHVGILAGGTIIKVEANSLNQNA